MRIERRLFIQLGGFHLLTSLAARCRRGDDEEGAADAGQPLEDAYLVQGLDVLCAAHENSSFRDGHRGAAILAAWFLCRTNLVDSAAVQVVRRILDESYPRADDSGFPAEEAEQDGVRSLLAALEPDIAQLVRDGHNVIFLSLALRALAEVPHLATPARLQGLRKTITALAPRTRGTGSIEIPAVGTPLAAFTLEEFLAHTHVHAHARIGAAGTGYVGHVLTYGCAILDLHALGHRAFADKCRNGFSLQLERVRGLTAEVTEPVQPTPREFPKADTKEYWVRRREGGELQLGHLFKYPYAFLRLLGQSGNEALNVRCSENSYHLFNM